MELELPTPKAQWDEGYCAAKPAVVLEATKMFLRELNLAGMGNDTCVAVVAGTAALLVYER
jgi:hypothetical protein